MPATTTTVFLGGNNAIKNQSPLSFFSSPFIDGNNNLQQRAVAGKGLIGEPYFSGISFHQKHLTKDNALRTFQTNYQEEILTANFDRGVVSSILERSVAQWRTAYLRIDNTGTVPLNNFYIDTSASGLYLPTSDWESSVNGSNNFHFYSGEGDLLWEQIAFTDSELYTSTGEVTNNQMKLVRRCLPNNPRTLAAGSFTAIVLNVDYVGWLRIRVGSAAGTGAQTGNLIMRLMLKN